MLVLLEEAWRSHHEGASGGLTVRCFRNDRPPDGWCPADVARLVSIAMPVSAAICGPDGYPAADRTPATSVDTGGP
jgi:hypothetical protein